MYLKFRFKTTKGDQVVNENLAQTFETISKDRDAFYKLPLAQERLSDYHIKLNLFNVMSM